MVATNEASAPSPTVGWPLARTGGQSVAHSPVHALFVPESFLNRYTVWPCESTRIFPRPLLATSTVPDCPLIVVAVVADDDAFALSSPLLPQPAANAASATAAPAR